jgi:hypothetical protein
MFMLENAEIAETDQPGAFSFAMDGKLGKRVIPRISSLNQLIASFFEGAHDELKASIELTNEYRKCAVSVFGESFPKIIGKGEADA